MEGQTPAERERQTRQKRSTNCKRKVSESKNDRDKIDYITDQCLVELNREKSFQFVFHSIDIPGIDPEPVLEKQSASNSALFIGLLEYEYYKSGGLDFRPAPLCLHVPLSLLPLL